MIQCLIEGRLIVLEDSSRANILTSVSRFVSDDEVHFPGSSLDLAGRSGAGAAAQEARRGKQGLLSCMMGCTRELRVTTLTYSVLFK